MKVLYVGGTGEISCECVRAGVELGQQVTVFNRARREEPLPEGVRRIVGDRGDPAAYAALADMGFDAVCQFIAYRPDDIARDAEVFGGKVGQYVFISSASAYQKPPRRHVVTEDTPLENPYWQYSRDKAACEAMLMDLHRRGVLPATIVRPSHTYRCRLITPFAGDDLWAWRLTHGKGVISLGDGTSLWTVTHSADFARAFVRLLGNARALGEAFHITDDSPHPWDRIWQAVGAALGVEPTITHVPTETLLRYNPDWTGALLGDKCWSVIFDNSKVRSAVGDWSCRIGLEEGMRLAAGHVRKRLESFRPDEATDALIDRIIAQQLALGR